MALPLTISPSRSGITACEYAESNQEFVERAIDTHGALLFRGFGVASAAQLEPFIRVTSAAPLEYVERSSPRTLIEANIYTSTDYPANQSIFLHNEQSYNLSFPLRIYFCCIREPTSQGETPIADCRSVFRRLARTTVERFRDGYLLVRNFGIGPGMTWQVAFQTEDRTAVEEYCRRHQIEYEWRPKDRLRTRQLRRAYGRHPRTGEQIWFNHCTFFHLSTLPALFQEVLGTLDPEDLPNQTYFADGTSIDAGILEELRGAYAAESTQFSWQAGDVLLLDNMMIAHGRRPFSGPRKVIVGMAQLYPWSQVV